MSDYTIRRAAATDSESVVPLLLSSGPASLVWTYGLGKQQRCTDFLNSAFKRDDTVFSWPHAYVVEDSRNQIVGLMYLHNRQTVEDLSGSSIAHLFRYFGFSIGAWTYWRTIRLGRSIPEPKPGCLHVSGLAIDERARGQGILAQMIELAYAEAVRTGAEHLSLDVEKTNDHAQRCYESKGFILRYTRPSPAKGLQGYRYYTRPVSEFSGEEHDDD